MTQQLRTLVALVKDLGLSPSTHVVTQKICHLISRESKRHTWSHTHIRIKHYYT